MFCKHKYIFNNNLFNYNLLKRFKSDHPYKTLVNFKSLYDLKNYLLANVIYNKGKIWLNGMKF